MSRGEEVFGSAKVMAEDMASVINSPEFSDITFLVGEGKEKMYAHKVVLAARCEVFRAMFAEQKSQAKKGMDRKHASSSSDAPLVLQDVRPSVFLTVLEFIYTNRCKLSQKTVVDVLASAIEYGLDGLAKCCSDFIQANITVDTACTAMQAAIAYNQADLRNTCMQFIEENTRAVFKSRHFVEMSADTFAHILQSDNLLIDEVDVLASVKEWGTVNSVVTGQTMAETLRGVVEHVRFPLLDESTLHKVEEENEKTPVIPVKLIAKAWKFQATKRSDPTDPHFRPRAGTHKA